MTSHAYHLKCPAMPHNRPSRPPLPNPFFRAAMPSRGGQQTGRLFPKINCPSCYFFLVYHAASPLFQGTQEHLCHTNQSLQDASQPHARARSRAAGRRSPRRIRTLGNASFIFGIRQLRRSTLTAPTNHCWAHTGLRRREIRALPCQGGPLAWGSRNRESEQARSTMNQWPGASLQSAD